MRKESILKRLEKKQKLDPDYIAFGVKRHRYELNYPLGKWEVEEIEAKFNIKLPDDYRKFISYIADGGAGPGHGLFPLKKSLKYLGSKINRKKITKDFIRPDELSEDEWCDSGLLILCEHGCANDTFLVINGKERGYVWELVEWAGYIPLLKNPPKLSSGRGLSEQERNRQETEWLKKLYKASDDEKMTFKDWYKSWLQEIPVLH